MKTDVVLIGGGGHCRSCIDVIEKEGSYGIAGIIDLVDKLNQSVLDYSIIGTEEDLPTLAKNYRNYLITVGQMMDPGKRVALYNLVKDYKGVLPVIVSPSANVSKYAVVGEGTIIMHNACINAGVRLGNNCIINTGAIIEHDCIIGDHCHISTGCVINGSSSVGSKSFIGSNSTLIQQVQLQENTVIGAGSVVRKSIKKSGVYAGIPARRIGKRA